MTVQLDRLIVAIAAFETGHDLSVDNPFDVDSVVSDLPVLDATLAFVNGNAVPAAPGRPPELLEAHEAVRDMVESVASAAAHAAFLQGLAIGYEYREGEA